jgi:hypothetical protein
VSLTQTYALALKDLVKGNNGKPNWDVLTTRDAKIANGPLHVQQSLERQRTKLEEAKEHAFAAQLLVHVKSLIEVSAISVQYVVIDGGFLPSLGAQNDNHFRGAKFRRQDHLSASGGREGGGGLGGTETNCFPSHSFHWYCCCPALPSQAR